MRLKFIKDWFSRGFSERTGNVLMFLTWVVAFFLVGMIGQDPDLGWHLKNGELILKTGILRTEPYSYTMTSFPYVDHEWLSNVIVFLVFSKIGYWGLAVVFAAWSSIIWLLLPNKAKSFQIGLIWLVLPALLSLGGVRFQLISWVFLWVFLRICFEEHLWVRWRCLIIWGMLLWANLHGSFPVGYMVMGIAIMARWLRTRKIDLYDWAVLITSGLVSLVNPYSWRVWEEVRRSMSDPLLGKYVTEWQMITPTRYLSYWFLLVIVCFFIWRYKKEVRLEKVILVGLLVVMGLKNVRHTSLSALGLLWIGTE